MKRNFYVIIIVLLAGAMIGCFEDKKINPAIETPKVEEISPAIPNKMPVVSQSNITTDAVASVPGFRQGNIIGSVNYDKFMSLVNEPTDEKMVRLNHMGSGDLYFTIVLDDNSHYICTSVDELVKILVMMEYFARSGDMITASDVEEYLSDYMFDNYLNGQFRRKMSVILESLAGSAYTERPNDSTYKNWESRGI